MARLLPETVRSLASGSVVAGYTAIGTALLKPSRLITISNFTDESVMISFDGTNDHVALATSTSLVLDIMGNRDQTERGLYLAEGTILYVKRIGTPTTGSVYVSSFYGSSD